MFDNRYFLFDFARGRKLDRKEAADLLDILTKCGYNGVCLHLEGFFETKTFPGAVRDGFFTLDDAKWFSQECKNRELKLIPIVNFVGHAESFVHYQERFAHLRRKNSKHHQLDLNCPELENLAHTFIDELIDIYNPECLHIGGDECELNAEEKKIYTVFLSKLCEYLRGKNIVPCIWSDMLYENQEMVEGFTRDVTVFDWWYMAHRPESLEFFKEKGFKDIYACPSNQGWDGFIGLQRRCPWPNCTPKDERNVAYNEVEAFLDDAKNLGIKNALFTDWENNSGHNLWSQMSLIARGALFMNDKTFSVGEIENTLFGRVTPYTEISYLLQELQAKIYEVLIENKCNDGLTCRMSDAVYLSDKFNLLLEIAPVIMGDIEVMAKDAFAKCDKLFSEFKPQNDVEKRCYNSLYATLYYAKSIYEIINLGANGYKHYHNAAIGQFSDLAQSKAELGITAKYYDELIKTVSDYRKYQKAAINDCGQTAKDLILLHGTIKNLKKIKANLSSYAKKLSANNHSSVLPSFMMLNGK